ncbi:hypothetical protein H5410_050141 [Solanum commersonii]|uniref:DUF4283 domain-containing protein n=1 Tax=Solanum commersonii TaxID=4109 RepID=A0A9J5WUQ1_SOLCO|nr:hypothetical protein H5410_050141 [Solanum commersonii]
MVCNRIDLPETAITNSPLSSLSTPHIPALTVGEWDPLFDPVKETSIEIAGISFPSLPPNFFGKESVEVDPLGNFPKRINLGMKTKTREKWITIKYGYVPKYYKSCKLHGHNEQECFKEQENPTVNNDFQEQRGKKVAKEGAEKVWYPRPKQTRTNEVTTTNKFGALEGEHKEDSHKERDNDRKDEEKGTQVEEQVQDITQHEERNNKKEVIDTQNSVMDKDDAQSAIKNVVNIPDKSGQSVEGMNDKEKEADRE